MSLCLDAGDYCLLMRLKKSFKDCLSVKAWHNYIDKLTLECISLDKERRSNKVLRGVASLVNIQKDI